MRDEKLVSAAVKSKQSVERVVWVWGAILESASEVQDGGRYEFDAGEAAYFLRCDATDIFAIVAALEDLERIQQGVVVRWSDRQYESDSSTERVRKHRGKQADAPVRQRSNVADNTGNTAETGLKRSVTPPETEADTDTDRTATSVAVSATPKDELQVLEIKLREAAGWQREPHPNLCVVGPIAELIATGASLELDILPVVRSRAPSVTSRTGWRYFIAPIQDAVKARVGAKALVPGDAIALESRRKAALEKLQTHNAQVDLERKRAANG